MVEDNSTFTDCLHQRDTGRGITCKIAKIEGSRIEIRPNVCRDCEIGRINRELGCKNIAGTPTIHQKDMGWEQGWHSILSPGSIFCKNYRKDTDFKNCEKCPDLSGEFTKPIIQKALSMLEKQGFEGPHDSLLKAVVFFNKGEDYYREAVSNATTAVEETLKMLLDKLGKDIPANRTLKELWKKLIPELDFMSEGREEAVNRIKGALSSLISAEEDLRKDASSEHTGSGKTPASLAGLTVNLSATFIEFVIQRFLELQGN